jgi:HD domain.
MSSEKPIAHVKKNTDGSWAEPQCLEEHLAGTAKLAEDFARAFGSNEWGRVCGLAHDTGKSPDAWQRYLKTKSGYDEEAPLESKAGKLDRFAVRVSLFFIEHTNAVLLNYLLSHRNRQGLSMYRQTASPGIIASESSAMLSDASTCQLKYKIGGNTWIRK